VFVTPKEVVVFRAKDGRVPFEEWLDDLNDKKAMARVLARLARVRQGNLGDCKSVGEGVSELRVDYGPGYRVYFGQKGQTLVVLLCGGDKRTQDRDIRLAKQYWREFKTNQFMKPVSYKNILREKLDDPEQAAEYLTACYEEGPEVFLVGLRDVVEAQGGVARASELSKLNRESLYRLFSREGNPRLSSLTSVLSALGLKVTFEAA